MNGLTFYEKLFGPKPRNRRKSLDRASLPTPLQYLTGRGLLKGKTRGEWLPFVALLTKAARSKGCGCQVFPFAFHASRQSSPQKC